MAFTSETARENQVKATEARKAAKDRVLMLMQTLANPTESSEFTEKTLARVRLQLDKVYGQFMHEKDPAKLDRLAAAQARLAEQERQLAGRPLPGSLKPTSTKPKRQNQPDGTPLD